MSLSVPTDVLAHVSDFTQERTLSQVCSRLWRTLGHRHLACSVTAATAWPKLARLAEFAAAGMVRTLEVVGDALGEEVAALVTLRAVPHLTSLRLLLSKNNLEDEALRAIALGVADLRGLTELQLDLAGNRLSDAGPLAALVALPSLRTLAVDLSYNRLSDQAGQALAPLSRHTTLTRLALELQGNRLRDTGAADLAGVLRAPALTHLRVNLGHNRVHLLGARSFATVNSTETLVALDLGFGGNALGPTGTATIMGLCDVPHLQHLSLNLATTEIAIHGRRQRHATGPNASRPQPGSPIRDAFALELANFGPHALFCPALPARPATLSLDLSHNGLRDHGLGPLRHVVAVPGLQALRLRLNRNKLGSEAACAVAALQHSDTLTALYVDLSENQIGFDGALALSDLKLCPSLATLTLRVAGNDLPRGAVQALLTLRDAPRLVALQLDLSQNEGGFGAGVLQSPTAGNTRLKHLSVDFSHNSMRDRDLSTLASLVSESPALTSLHLGLANNEVSGCTALRDLQHHPSLQTISLDLSCNQLEDAVALSHIGQRASPTSPAAHTLALDLAGNNLGDAAVEGLAPLVGNLATLTLSLCSNRFSDRGAQALVSHLSHPQAGPPRAVKLNLWGNQVSPETVTRLQALQQAGHVVAALGRPWA